MDGPMNVAALIAPNQGHVFQIQHDGSAFCFRADQRFQLGYIVLGHSAAQRKDRLPTR
jgi:alpha-tubulin suppressor-like RCC1 family protein